MTPDTTRRLEPDEVCWACLGAGTVRYGGLAAEFQHDDPCPTCGGTGQPEPKET